MKQSVPIDVPQLSGVVSRAGHDDILDICPLLFPPFPSSSSSPSFLVTVLFYSIISDNSS